MTAALQPQPSERQATLDLQLERDQLAPSRARAAMIGRCEGFNLDEPLLDTLALLVSEVVANAVRHSRAPAQEPIVLAASVSSGAVHVAVTDAGDGFALEELKPPDVHGGWGLYLLDTSASRWGVNRAAGTRVWFELRRTATPPRGPSARIGA
jgi:anti-sigma regulatory factor (Ser/Thr protein kinase)